MDLLMAEEMNQNQVAVAVCSPLGASMEVMDVEFLFVKKRFSTLGTSPTLSLRELLFGERQVFCLRGLSFLPVGFQTGVVWRSFSPYQRMPFNGEPVKSEQISSGAFVTKRPGVKSIQIELSPIPLPLPFNGLLGVHPLNGDRKSTRLNSSHT